MRPMRLLRIPEPFDHPDFLYSLRAIADELNAQGFTTRRGSTRHLAMGDTTPFRGQRKISPAPTRTLYRFEKPGGHWAEIRERTIAALAALGSFEYIVFVDGSSDG